MLLNELPDPRTDLVEPKVKSGLEIQDYGFAVDLAKYDIRSDRDGVVQREFHVWRALVCRPIIVASGALSSASGFSEAFYSHFSAAIGSIRSACRKGPAVARAATSVNRTAAET